MRSEPVVCSLVFCSLDGAAACLGPPALHPPATLRRSTRRTAAATAPRWPTCATESRLVCVRRLLMALILPPALAQVIDRESRNGPAELRARWRRQRKTRSPKRLSSYATIAARGVSSARPRWIELGGVPSAVVRRCHSRSSCRTVIPRCGSVWLPWAVDHSEGGGRPVRPSQRTSAPSRCRPPRQSRQSPRGSLPS